MSTIHFNQTTTVTPEQYTAGLTDFGPGRSKIFGNSADERPEGARPAARVTPTSPRAPAASGSACSTTGPIPTMSSPRTTDSNAWGGRSGHTYTFTRNADGTTDIDYVVVREGKNLKGRFLGIVLGSVGKSRLVKAFNNSVKAIEARNYPAPASQPMRLLRNARRRRAGRRRRHRGDGPVALRRYRRDGGKDSLWRWEFAGDVMSWDDASAPGQLGRKAAAVRYTGHEPPDEWARRHNEHRALGDRRRMGRAIRAVGEHDLQPPVGAALALGPVVWLSGYVVLPLAKVYKPIWDYDARTLAKDLSAHLLYGTAIARRLLPRATP